MVVEFQRVPRASCDGAESRRPHLRFESRSKSSDRLADLARGHAFAWPPLAARATWALSTDVAATPFDGVQCRLVHDEGGAQPAPPRTVEEAGRSLRLMLDASIQRAVGDAQRIAVMTGGGLDSGALLALVVDHARRAGKTAFAVALDFEAEGDDRPYLRALEAHLRCEVLRVRPEEAAPHLKRHLHGVDGAPLYCPTQPLEIALMTHARARGADVVLMGVGGDQIFDGRPTSLSELVHRSTWREALRETKRLTGFSRPRFPVWSWLVRPWLARSTPRVVRVLRARREALDVPAWAGPTLLAFQRAERTRRAATLAEMHPSASRLERHFLDAQRVQVAWIRHQEEEAAGVARADPYLDRSLIDMMKSIPAHWVLHSGTRRGLFRHVVRELLPDSLLARQDKASFEPALARMVDAAGGLATLFRDEVPVERLSRAGIVDAARFREAYEDFVRDPHDPYAWTSVWCALMVEAFLRGHG